MQYVDYALKRNNFDKMQVYGGEYAVMLAIRNLLVSPQGCWPFIPKMGIDIQKYQFETADETTLKLIEKDVRAQITEYVPTVDSVSVICKLINTNSPTRKDLSIYINGYVAAIDREVQLAYIFDATTKNGDRQIKVLSTSLADKLISDVVNFKK